MVIGERIRNERLKKGYTQKELGDLIGVSSSAICGYENGKKKPALSIIIRLSSVLNLSIDYLLGRDIKVVCENEEEYSIMIAKEDLIILNELKKNRMLYKNFFINPKRTIKRINSVINW